MIYVVVGTRPEIIKMSPIIKECERQKLDYCILHTGQHYSFGLDGVFFEQLGVPKPKYNLSAGSSTDVREIASMMFGLEDKLTDERPSVVLVEGDTNTALAAALVASKLHINIGHVEAGLRSGDRRMQEEINRILIDHCSAYLFAPTAGARDNLLQESIPHESICVTGNTVVDALHQNIKRAEERVGPLSTTDYALVTLHRQENVDDMETFGSVLEGLRKLSQRMKVIYPVHPRARKRMQEFHLQGDGMILLCEVDYFSFLMLEKHARIVLTDSGGVQEEVCVLGVPCVTVRDSTERPETVDVGANIIAGTKSERILECVDLMLGQKNSWKNPFGDGKAGERIVGVLRREYG